jgi:membrane associated rhomboid family serine protease
MSTQLPAPKRSRPPASRGQTSIEGLALLAVVVGIMWLVEVINSLDSNRLDADGIRPRDFADLWGIFTAPFLHVGFNHLIANTIPLVFMGVIIAMRGAAKVAIVTLVVLLVGGLGTWLIAPSGSVTVGASGLVFGYAAYLLTRGLFDRSALELLTGVVVGVVWGSALLSSLVPHYGISWQGHLCGAIGGVIAAWLLADRPGPAQRWRTPGTRPGSSAPGPLLP